MCYLIKRRERERVLMKTSLSSEWKPVWPHQMLIKITLWSKMVGLFYFIYFKRKNQLENHFFWEGRILPLDPFYLFALCCVRLINNRTRVVFLFLFFPFKISSAFFTIPKWSLSMLLSTRLALYLCLSGGWGGENVDAVVVVLFCLCVCVGPHLLGFLYFPYIQEKWAQNKLSFLLLLLLKEPP